MSRNERRRKYTKLMRSRGVYQFVNAQPVREHIEYLRGRGMRVEEIGRRSGINPKSLRNIYRPSDRTKPAQKKMYVRTANAIMGVVFDETDIFQADRIRGASRIMQGLAMAGWTVPVIAEEVGCSAETVPNWIGARSIGPGLYYKLRETAWQLEGKSPQDYGISLRVSRATISKARGRGYAPLTCWEYDTVHSADVYPEWTGKCGTTQGYYIHYRDKIPMCRNCYNANRVQKSFPELGYMMRLQGKGMTGKYEREPKWNQ